MLRIYRPTNYTPWNDRFAIACSGGFDSMAITDFFVKGRRKPVLLHVNHVTGNDEAQTLVEDYAKAHDLELMLYKVNPEDKDKKQSWEEFWRIQRMHFFNNIDMPVITGHNLDDAMETWLFSSMHGNPKLIPYNTNNIYRPFILNRKDTLREYAIKNNVRWAEDLSNTDVKYPRNRIRHKILPEVMCINTGFDTVIKKKYLNMRTIND